MRKMYLISAQTIKYFFRFYQIYKKMLSSFLHYFLFWYCWIIHRHLTQHLFNPLKHSLRRKLFQTFPVLSSTKWKAFYDFLNSIPQLFLYDQKQQSHGLQWKTNLFTSESYRPFLLAHKSLNEAFIETKCFQGKAEIKKENFLTMFLVVKDCKKNIKYLKNPLFSFIYSLFNLPMLQSLNIKRNEREMDEKYSKTIQWMRRRKKVASGYAVNLKFNDKIEWKSEIKSFFFFS